MPLHLALRQCAHAVHKFIPLRDGDAQLFLHGLRIKARVVRHLDCACSAVQGDGQGVVANYTHGGRGRGGGQRTVTGGG
ncbi:hypothetical protein D3C80_1698890 [compost metagenome]